MVTTSITFYVLIVIAVCTVGCIAFGIYKKVTGKKEPESNPYQEAIDLNLLGTEGIRPEKEVHDPETEGERSFLERVCDGKRQTPTFYRNVAYVEKERARDRAMEGIKAKEKAEKDKVK
ncbi:MAG: hypothetical protein RR313_00835 [Anaerovoracaceae bacterium]